MSSLAAESLDVQLMLDKMEGSIYEMNEKIEVKFTANKDCYVTVYAIDTENRLRLLFPLNRFRNNFVQRGKIYSIPDDWDYPDLRASLPEGLYYIQLVATTEPQDIPDWPSYHKRQLDNDIRAYGKPEEAVVELNKKISRIEPDPKFYDESRAYFYVQERVNSPVYQGNQSEQVVYVDNNDDDTHLHISIGYGNPYWNDFYYGYNSWGWWDPFYWDYYWYPSFSYHHRIAYYPYYRDWYYYNNWYDPFYHHHRSHVSYYPKSYKSKPIVTTRSKNRAYDNLALSKSYKNSAVKSYKSKTVSTSSAKVNTTTYSKTTPNTQFSSKAKPVTSSSVKTNTPVYKTPVTSSKVSSSSISSSKTSGVSREPVYKSTKKYSPSIYSTTPKVEKKGYQVDRSKFSSSSASKSSSSSSSNSNTSSSKSYYKTYPQTKSSWNSSKSNSEKYKQDYRKSIQSGSSSRSSSKYNNPVYQSSNKTKSTSRSSYKSSSPKKNSSSSYKSSYRSSSSNSSSRSSSSSSKSSSSSSSKKSRKK